MPNFVMTGGSSGLGEHATRVLLKTPEMRLLLGGRNQGPQGAEMLPLDLGSMESVWAFAEDVKGRLKSGKIDALVFNAGMQKPDVSSRTPEGFETTFAVNHLAHYWLLRRLLPLLAEGARVVLTTSGTHDPAEKTIIPPPHHADARLLAHPEKDLGLDLKPSVAGGRAYSASKLCVLLTARALAAQDECRSRGIRVVAYDPGPTPGTGLVRGRSSVVKFLWRILGSAWLLPLFPNMNSQEAAGQALADLALGRERPPEGRVYAALRRNVLTWPDPSELARRDDVMQVLWDDSARLLGMTL